MKGQIIILIRIYFAIYRRVDWVKAKGTTLGADNGIDVASALAV